MCKSLNLSLTWKTLWQDGEKSPLLNAFPMKTIMAERADCAEMLLQSEKLSPLWPSFAFGVGRGSWGLRSSPGAVNVNTCEHHYMYFCIYVSTWICSLQFAVCRAVSSVQIGLMLPSVASTLFYSTQATSYICPVKSLWVQAATLWILFLQ